VVWLLCFSCGFAVGDAKNVPEVTSAECLVLLIQLHSYPTDIFVYVNSVFILFIFGGGCQSKIQLSLALGYNYSKTFLLYLNSLFINRISRESRLAPGGGLILICSVKLVYPSRWIGLLSRDSILAFLDRPKAECSMQRRYLL